MKEFIKLSTNMVLKFTVQCFSVPDEDFCAVENPCMNGGTCEVVPHDFSCTCPQYIIGKSCEGRISFLSPSVFVILVYFHKLLAIQN